MAIIFVDRDKERRARQAVKSKGGNPDDDSAVLEEYKKIAGFYRETPDEKTKKTPRLRGRPKKK